MWLFKTSFETFNLNNCRVPETLTSVPWASKPWARSVWTRRTGSTRCSTTSSTPWGPCARPGPSNSLTLKKCQLVCSKRKLWHLKIEKWNFSEVGSIKNGELRLQLVSTIQQTLMKKPRFCSLHQILCSTLVRVSSCKFLIVLSLS